MIQENRETEPGTGNRVRLTGNRLEPEPAWTGTGLNRNRSVQYCTVPFIRYDKKKSKTRRGGAMRVFDFFFPQFYTLYKKPFIRYD